MQKQTQLVIILHGNRESTTLKFDNLEMEIERAQSARELILHAIVWAWTKKDQRRQEVLSLTQSYGLILKRVLVIGLK